MKSLGEPKQGCQGKWKVTKHKCTTVSHAELQKKQNTLAVVATECKKPQSLDCLSNNQAIFPPTEKSFMAFYWVIALTIVTGITEPTLCCSAPQSSGLPYRPFSRMKDSPQKPGSSNTTQLRKKKKADLLCQKFIPFHFKLWRKSAFDVPTITEKENHKNLDQSCAHSL